MGLSGFPNPSIVPKGGVSFIAFEPEVEVSKIRSETIQNLHTLIQAINHGILGGARYGVGRQ